MVYLEGPTQRPDRKGGRTKRPDRKGGRTQRPDRKGGRIRHTMTPAIQKKLRRVQTSLQLQLLVNWAARGLAVGALMAALLMAASRFYPLDIDIIRVSISLLTAGLVLGSLASLLRPISMFEAALACDLRLQLKERITSAIEFTAQKETNPLIPALISDAERHAAIISPGRDFPIRTPRDAIYALILLAIAIGLYFVPPWQYTFASDETREEYREVQAEAQAVRDIAREITLDPPAERNDFAEEIARQLEQLARDMEFGTLSRREALERLSAIEEAIEQSQESSGYNELREQIDRLSQALAEGQDLREAAEALSSGDAEAAQRALEELAENLESGNVPTESLSDLAGALDQAAAEMAGNPNMSDLRESLEQARDELRAAAEAAASGSESQPDPEEMARALIDAIDRAIPEIDSLDIPEDVREQAKEILEEVRDDLQEALDSGEVTEQDIREAQERIQDVRETLEEAGADLSGEQEERSPEEIAEELIREAQRLERAAQSCENLDSRTRRQLQSTCENVAQELGEELEQGSCSTESNEEARRQLDEVRRQLEEAGSTEEEMGERSQCSGSGSRSGRQGSGGRQGQGSSGLGNLFAMRPGSQGGMAAPSGATRGAMGRAGQALKDAGESLGQYGQCLGSGSRFDNAQQGLCRSRCRLSGACSGRQSGGEGTRTGRAAGGWGRGTSPYAVSPAPVTPGHSTEHSQDPNETPNQTRRYQELYNPAIKPSQSYETRLEGKFTDTGGSYVFTEIVDPETGETSYVPYFSLEPTDVSALMDAIEDQDIPRSYADFVRFYFEQLAQGSNTVAEDE